MPSCTIVLLWQRFWPHCNDRQMWQRLLVPYLSFILSPILCLPYHKALHFVSCVPFVLPCLYLEDCKYYKFSMELYVDVPLEQTSDTPNSTSAVAVATTLTASESSSLSSTTWMPTPVMSPATFTNQVRTVTATPTVPKNPQSLMRISGKSRGSLSLGRAVGLAS